MPAAQAHATIDGAVAVASSDLRQFSRCFDRAQAAQTPGEVGVCLRQLAGLRAALQEHRAQLRQRIAALGAREAGKDRLGAVRASIERALRQLQDFERKAGPTPPGLACDADARRAASPPPGAGPVGSSVPSDSGEDAGEAKVLQSQLAGGRGDEDVAQEFVCKICLDVVGCAPRLTRCAHLFCGDCIRQWFAAQPQGQTWAGRAKSTGTVPCPVCKEPLSEKEDLHLVGPGQRGNGAFLWNMLSGIEVRCSNHPSCTTGGRCDWAGTYGEFQAHIQECENVPLRCEPAAEAGEALESEVPPTPVHDANCGDPALALDESCPAAAMLTGESVPETLEGSVQFAVPEEQGPVVWERQPHDPAGVSPEVFEGVEAVSVQYSVLGQVGPAALLNQTCGAVPEETVAPKSFAVLEPLQAPESSTPANIPLASQEPVPAKEFQAMPKKTKQQRNKIPKAPNASAVCVSDQAAEVANADASAERSAAAHPPVYAQHAAQWQAAHAAQQMVYAARFQAAQTQMAYVAQCQAAYAAQFNAAYAARVRAAALNSDK